MVPVAFRPELMSKNFAKYIINKAISSGSIISLDFSLRKIWGTVALLKGGDHGTVYYAILLEFILPSKTRVCL